MQIKVSPNKVLRALLISIAILGVMHIVIHAAFIFGPYPGNIDAALHLFDMDQELSIPTWFSQFVLLGAGLAALVVGVSRRRNKKSYYKHWLGIWWILLYMSIDEGSSIHELLADPLADYFHTQGTIFAAAWTIAGLAAVAIVGLVYLKFWLRLPKRTRILLAVSAVIYVLGTVGMEIVGSFVIDYTPYGYGSALYTACTLIEESMEVIGAVLAMYSFMDYQADDQPNTKLILTKK